MSYINHVPREHGQPLDLIAASIFPPMLQSAESIHEVLASYRTAKGMDLRWQIGKTDQGFLLTTAAGLADDSDPLSATDRVHAVLIDEFFQNTTESAKGVWKYARTSY